MDSIVFLGEVTQFFCKLLTPNDVKKNCKINVSFYNLKVQMQY